MRLLYTALFYAALPLILGRVALRSRKLPVYGERWRERFAFYKTPPAKSGVIWFHAVSVGEAEAAFPVIRAMRAGFPSRQFLVTCTTPTGSARIQAVLGEGVQHVYLPYDLPGSVARFLNQFRPVLGVVMETEIWPNLYRECRRRGIRLAIVNGRLSQQSARGYQWIGDLAAASLAAVDLVAAQTLADAERFITIGANPDQVLVTGNVKFDLVLPEDLDRCAQAMRAELFGERPVWIAGSTHPGEDEKILAAFRHVRKQVPEALLVLAPRHPERAGDLWSLCVKSGFSARRRSEARPCGQTDDIFLLDTLGELRLFYAASDLAFVGGSLVPLGGHNVLEPAAVGLPTLFGPHMFNFAEIKRGIKESGGGIEVHDSDDLAAWAVRLLAEPGLRIEIGAKGRDFVISNRGAVQRVADLIAALLEPAREISTADCSGSQKKI